MARNVPSYLETIVAESGDTETEILLSLVKATEEQTDKLGAIATALERIADKIGNSWMEQ